MALPRFKKAREYYRAAEERLADAEVLFAAGRTTGAVYVSGYAVECFLKALLLEGTPVGARMELQEEFFGKKAHDLESLSARYRRRAQGRTPVEVDNLLYWLAGQWTTDLRYETRVLSRTHARDVLDAVTAVVKWAKGRM
jgi:HEPN domain-containing protein